MRTHLGRTARRVARVQTRAREAKP
jgi:hypothetical protein